MTVAKGTEAYINGVTEDKKSLEEVAVNLRKSSKQLSDSLGGRNIQPNISSIDPEEKRSTAIARKCENIAATLICRLETFKVEPCNYRKLMSLGKAMKAAWKKDEIERLEEKLKSYQSALDTEIIVSLRWVHSFIPSIGKYTS